MTQINFHIEEDVKENNADPFYSAENMAELEKRIADIRNGTSIFKEHNLIETDD